MFFDFIMGFFLCIAAVAVVLATGALMYITKPDLTDSGNKKKTKK